MRWIASFLINTHRARCSCSDDPSYSLRRIGVSPTTFGSKIRFAFSRCDALMNCVPVGLVNRSCTYPSISSASDFHPSLSLALLMCGTSISRGRAGGGLSLLPAADSSRIGFARCRHDHFLVHGRSLGRRGSGSRCDWLGGTQPVARRTS